MPSFSYTIQCPQCDEPIDVSGSHWGGTYYQPPETDWDYDQTCKCELTNAQIDAMDREVGEEWWEHLDTGYAEFD